jgi:hypothetical protein
MMSETPQRYPLKGSCHCGTIQYILHVKLPHEQHLDPKPRQRIYRCNCNICHKAGYLHVRPKSAPKDFLLLSPLDPMQELGDYQCDAKQLHFLFCKNCGVRCFTFMGQGEVVDADLGALGVGDGTVKAWRPKLEGWTEDKRDNGSYLSVNANTLEPNQQGFDLREWHEKKWVCYLDFLKAGTEEEMGFPRYERPFEGGAY